MRYDIEQKHDYGSYCHGDSAMVRVMPETVIPHDTLRPTALADFVGQAELKMHLGIILGAAQSRGEAAGHLLFAGPAGLGKTSLAAVVATEMGATFVPTFAPNLKTPEDLHAILLFIEEGNILFVDEIHSLSRKLAEILYTAVEDFVLDFVIEGRPVRLPLPHFTLIGATTRPGEIDGPLRDRFAHVARLDYYNAEELAQVVERSAGLLGVEITAEGAGEIGRRSRGTPRIANRLLERVRDYAQFVGTTVVDLELAAAALEVFGSDHLGLDKVDREILTALAVQFKGKPVGLATLAAIVGEEASTLESVQEPYLLRLGLIERTGRGRKATAAAWSHLGLPVPYYVT